MNNNITCNPCPAKKSADRFLTYLELVTPRVFFVES